MSRTATWRERLSELGAIFGTLPRAVGMVLRDCPGYTGLLIVSRVLEGLLPLLTIWMSKMVIDGVVGLSTSGMSAEDAFRTLLPLLLLYLALTVTGQVGAAFGGLSKETMSDRVLGRANLLLMEKVTSLPGLAPFESPEFHDALRNAREGVSSRPESVLNVVFILLPVSITCLGAGAILWGLHPLAFLLVLGATAPSAIMTQQLFTRMADLFRKQAMDARRLNYFSRLLTGDEAAKEIRLYGLAHDFRARYREVAERMFGQAVAHIRRFAVGGSAAALLEAGFAGGAYGIVVYQAARGDLTIGDLSMYAGAILQLQANLSRFLTVFSNGYEYGLYLRHFFDFLKRKPSIHLAPHDRAAAVSAGSRCGLEARGLSFRYPGTERPVLKDLDLRVAPGETVALVGANGCGKTTLVKLLTRLYDPTEGEILMDGRDIRSYDLEDYRAAIAAIFQDYCRYYMTARDNIALGAVGRRDDLRAIRRAAEQGQAASLVASLPEGYETMLGKRFNGGVDLSGGEWQKIALSRAFMRDARILILDEPSAALDVETEYAMYRRFAELTRGKTTLLISHRFTTVRMADRMVALDGGRIVEDGTHEALMARRGLYAEMFNAQAKQYR